PDDVDRVLVETGKRYNNGKTGNMHALNAILGNGLVASEGDFWRKQRKLMAPSFHHQSIKKYADLIVSTTQDWARYLAGWRRARHSRRHDGADPAHHHESPLRCRRARQCASGQPGL